MKDVFAEREVDNFYTLSIDFGESILSAFPECGETKDWLMWLRNIVGDDKEKRREAAIKWKEASQLPLVKGCAKYAKAVQCITNSPAMVYHAVSYKDVDAWHATDANIQGMDFPGKLKNMNDDDKAIFWQYVSEMNEHVYKGLRSEKPSVPTVDDISKNISTRRAATSKQPAGVRQGVVELWTKLCTARGVKPVEIDDVDKFSERVKEASQHVEAVRAKTAEAQGLMLEHFSELKADGSVFDDETWTLCDKLLSVSSMESAIPSGMMRGIESVAADLIKDIESGSASLDTLDLEKIGQQVLSNVSSDDVSSFAANLDKILPALSRMQ